MSALKLQKKLARREKQVAQSAANFDRYNKVNKREEIMEDSPKILKLLRGIARRLDFSFGLEALMKEPPLSARAEADLIRFDYDLGAPTDFGIKATFAAGVIAALGIRPNDKVLILEGDLKGKYLNVVAVSSSTELRLEDVATFVSANDIRVRVDMSAEKKSYV